MDRQSFQHRFPDWIDDWPVPSTQDWQRSLVLEQRIKACIRQQGSMPFENFMQMALYEPELGYYAVSNAKFGARGDFTTAPNISPIFSQCIANQCRQVLTTMHGGSIVEVGAGNGIMACDSLLFLEKEGCLPKKYLIVECSEGLKALQRQTIIEKAAHLLEYVDWLDEVPDAFEGVIVCNELLDAMPTRRFQWRQGQSHESCVVVDDQDELQEVYLTVKNSLLQQCIEKIQSNLPQGFLEGYCGEVNLQAVDWTQQMAGRLKKGLLLILDYGYPQHEYYHPQRVDGTRVCFYRHRRHNDPLILPGLQDISCHVDFTALTEVAVGNGLDLSGFSTQAGFLMGCGLPQWMEQRQQNISGSLSDSIILSNEVDKLLAPGEMGELVKAIGFQKDIDVSMVGFSLQDMSFRL